MTHIKKKVVVVVLIRISKEQRKKRTRQRIKDSQFEYQLDTSIMRLMRQQQQQLLCLFFIFITQLASSPIRTNLPIIRCDIRHRNCTLQHRNLSIAFLSTPRSSTPLRSIFSTSRIRSTTKVSSSDDLDAFSENLKRAALILAGVAFGLGILRVCLMLCKSRSRSNSVDNQHSSINRSRISTIEQHQFKPDSPPAYAEAIAHMDNEGGKLPTYEELPDEQRRAQEQYAHNNNQNVWISTQM